MIYMVVSKNELCHYGINGQKWGVRRFQNPDGTLTEAGKKRYSKELAKEFKKDSEGMFGKNQRIQNMVNKKIDNSDKESLRQLTSKYSELMGEKLEVYKKFEKSEYFKHIGNKFKNETTYEEAYEKAFEEYLNANKKAKNVVDESEKAWTSIEDKVSSISFSILGKYKDTYIKQINRVGTDIGGSLEDVLTLYILDSRNS